MADHMLEVADGFWNVRGSFRIVKVLDIGTQTSLVRLATGRFVLLDSYTLPAHILDQVHALTDGGEAIEAIVNLHPFHTVHVRGMHEQFPRATLFGTARHVAKKPELPWHDLRSEDPGLNELFGGEFRFMVPAGLDLVPADENVHASSVLALHRPSRTLHVDDTLGYLGLPVVGGVAFHPALRGALQRRPGAAAEFRAWAEELIEACEEVDHLCTAHTRTLPPLQGPEAVSAAVRKALGKVERTLRAHERRWG